jgi:hypothetical protein
MRKESLHMRSFSAGIAVVLSLAVLAGCSTNTGIAKITTGGGGAITFEMAVGTVNDPNGTLGFAGTTLNVVSSFRNGLGNSAYENPGQFSLTGPSGSIVQALAASAANADCDQLFSYGIYPGCVATIPGPAPYPPFVGQPPAYNPADTGSVPGYATGIIITGAPATSGSYTLATTVPVSGSNLSYSTSASLPSTPTVLPADAGVVNFASDGLGGGTFTITEPAGVTESLIIVMSGGSEVASLETTSTTATVTGTGSSCSNLSATGVPIPCGPFSAYVVGADYPLVEAGPPASKAAKPTLTGANGTSDITVSGIDNSLTE